MLPWLSPLCLMLAQIIQFGIMFFLEVQEINLQDNMRGSKCDEYCIFYENFFDLRKCSFPF